MDALAWVGVLASCGAAAAALVIRDPRLRVAAMLLALALAPALVAGDVADTERFRELRESPAQLVALGVVAALGVGAIAAFMLRLPAALPLLAFGTLAFRIPVELGGETSNLLIPLYLVIAAGAVATALATWKQSRDALDSSLHRRGASAAASFREFGARALPWLLAGFLILYALQSAYSSDLSKATETVSFFFVPFAVLLALLLDVRWTPRLLTALLVLVVTEALLFTGVGLWQYAARDLFWNPTVIAGNEVHTYFRVNSVFWDPNLFGRYLALAVLATAAYMVCTRRSDRALGAAAACVVLLVGLTISFSQSSIFALLAGLVALVALRWGVRWALGIGGATAIAALALVLLAGVEPTSERSLEVRSSGRVTLVRGGLELAGDRPAYGYGSGAFQEEFAQRYLDVDEPEGSAISHSEPVTVAAEQGAFGLVLYAALVVSGFAALLGVPGRVPAARAALIACFVAMVVHSLAYAGFLIDPATWALLGVGLALARAPLPSPLADRVERAPSRAPRARPSLAWPEASSTSPDH